jgi:4-hydroxybutyrate dehydrogenase
MKKFTVEPVVYLFDNCRVFAEEFQVGDGDLIFSSNAIYESHFAKLDLVADVLYKDSYGNGEPSDEMIEAIYADMKKSYKRIIAIGGGAILDIAKFLALSKISPLNDLLDRKLEIVKDKELILVPTTCGTGSEVTNISILEITSQKAKQGIADDQMYAESAVLIPELLNELSYHFFATGSLDALIHAMESSVSPKATPYTKLFSHRAIVMILRGYLELAKSGQDARFPLLKNFLLAANYAGIAFGNAGVGAVHAMSYPLGGKYHVPHGEANYALFLGVFRRYMSISQTGAIAELNRLMAQILGCKVADVYAKLGELLNTVLPLKPLREYGVKEQDIPVFTANVVEKQGRLTANNFVELSAGDITAIYEELL